MTGKIKLLLICIFTVFLSSSVIAGGSEKGDGFLKEYYSQVFGFKVSEIKFPKMLDVIDKWIGTPYRYGGKSAKGIDCSGFVSQLFNEAFNFILQGSSRDIFTRVKPLNKGQLTQGDLVFFKIRTNQISHVGVYIGQNKFAHASTSSGVVISDLEDAYYKKYFFKGGRIPDIK